MSLIILGCIFIIVFYWFIYIIGATIETKVPEDTRIKKFWRRHILAPDPNEPENEETRY